MFLDCKFEKNILGSFKSHKSRKHRCYSVKDLKPGIVVSATVAYPESASSTFDENIGEDAQPGSSADAPHDLPNVIEHSLAAALLKLEHFSNVPSRAINIFLVELHHLTVSQNLLLKVF